MLEDFVLIENVEAMRKEKCLANCYQEVWQRGDDACVRIARRNRRRI
jgi:hypothetical protein